MGAEPSVVGRQNSDIFEGRSSFSSLVLLLLPFPLFLLKGGPEEQKLSYSYALILEH